MAWIMRDNLASAITVFKLRHCYHRSQEKGGQHDDRDQPAQIVSQRPAGGLRPLKMCLGQTVLTADIVEQAQSDQGHEQR